MRRAAFVVAMTIAVPTAQGNAIASTLCASVGAAIEALAPPALPPHQNNINVDDPVLQLAHAGNIRFLVDETRSLPEDHSLLGRAFAQLADNASPPLRAAIEDLDPRIEASVWVRWFGTSSIGAIELMSLGTMHCDAFVFFEVGANGIADLLPPPPAAAVRERGFCDQDGALVAQLDQAPVFVSRMWEVTRPSYRLVLSAWTDDEWTSPCQIQVDYESEFTIVETHCTGDNCDELVAVALEAAPLFVAAEAGADFAPNPEGIDWDKFNRMVAEADAFGADVLPAPDRVAVREVYSDFEGTAFFPVAIGGITYLGRIGNGYVGWRVSPTILFAAYDLIADDLEPVAGIVLSQSQGVLTGVRLGGD